MFSQAFYYWVTINPTMAMYEKVDEYTVRALLCMMGYLVYDTVYELTAGRQVMTLGHHVLGFISHLTVLVSYNGAAGFYWYDHSRG